MPDAASWKRRRIVAEPETTPRYSLDDSDTDAPLYVPVKRRRELEIARLANKLASADDLQRRREDAEREDVGAAERGRSDGLTLATNSRFTTGATAGSTLLHEAQAVKERKAVLDAGKTAADKARDEQDAVANALTAVKRKLAPAQELAKGVSYTEALPTRSVGTLVAVLTTQLASTAVHP